EWQKSGMRMMIPWRDGDDRLQMLNLSWMIPGWGDLSEYDAEQFLTGRALVQNPFANIIAELFSKRQFSGAPLYYEWDDNRTKTASILRSLWRQGAPSIYSVDLAKLHERVSGDEDSLTYGQQLANQLGLKAEILDIAKNRRTASIRKNIYAREIRSNLKKKLRKATSDRERRKAVSYALRRIRKVVRDK
ncbi:hypothetical protein LCGC14_2785300, partial [marine sediment metagenome]